MLLYGQFFSILPIISVYVLDIFHHKLFYHNSYPETTKSS